MRTFWSQTYLVLPPKRLLITVLLLLSAFSAVRAQQKLLPLNTDRYNDIGRNIARFDEYRPVSMRPMVEAAVPLEDSSVYFSFHDSSKVYYDLFLKLYKESLFIIDGDDFHFTIDPLVHFEFGDEFQDTLHFAGTTRDKTFYRNYRGVRIQGDIGEDFSFGTWFYEQQATFPNYYDSIVDAVGAVPGIGRTKPFKEFGKDFAYAGGYFSVPLGDRVNLQAGHGKHIIGNGYRSMLLSDASFNYPYLRFNYGKKEGKLKYHVIYASLMNLRRLPEKTTPEATFEKKAASFHYLTFQPIEKIEIGLFEGTIWERWDPDQGTLPVNYMMFNPLIGVNSALMGLESRHNNLLGLNLAIFEPIKNLDIYGQLAIDDNDFEQLGWQVGLRAYDPFGLKKIILQGEYNAASPYTYGHIDRKEAYSHYDMPLAHPLGGAFDELMVMMRYEHKRFFAQGQVNVINYPLDSPISHEGKSVNKSETDASPGGFGEATVLFQNVEAGVYCNVKTGLQFLIGFTNRTMSSEVSDQQSTYMYFSVRTALRNLYHDL